MFLFFSVCKESGHFFSVDPSFDAEKFPTTKPEFKRSKKSKESDSEVDFVNKVKHINLYKYRDFDREFYRSTITDVLAFCEEEVITPYVSKTFGLYEVNEGIEFIRGKKGTGKILIDVSKVDPKNSSKSENTKKNNEGNGDNDDDDGKKSKKKDN